MSLATGVLGYAHQSSPSLLRIRERLPTLQCARERMVYSLVKMLASWIPKNRTIIQIPVCLQIRAFKRHPRHVCQHIEGTIEAEQCAGEVSELLTADPGGQANDSGPIGEAESERIRQQTRQSPSRGRASATSPGISGNAYDCPCEADRRHHKGGENDALPIQPSRMLNDVRRTNRKDRTNPQGYAANPSFFKAGSRDKESHRHMRLEEYDRKLKRHEQ